MSLARTTDPDTSHTAAALILPHRARACTLIFDALVAAGEATAAELAHATGMAQNCVARRLTDLAERGLADRAGVTVGPNHRPVTVWRPREETL